jgi:hypothetical protein
MRGVNQPICSGLDASLKGSGPVDDKAWDNAICQASVLNEVSYLLMEDGRCPDAVWADAAKSLREGSSQVVAALEKKDLESARAAFKTVTGACGSCHKAHKKQCNLLALIIGGGVPTRRASTNSRFSSLLPRAARLTARSSQLPPFVSRVVGWSSEA